MCPVLSLMDTKMSKNKLLRNLQSRRKDRHKHLIKICDECNSRSRYLCRSPWSFRERITNRVRDRKWQMSLEIAQKR